MSIQLSIIIPCYNESDSIYKLFALCKDSMLDRTDIEFVFVNNGSIDNTQVIIDSLLILPEYFFAKTVHVPINKGYGYGILEGLKSAGGSILAWTHADLQTDPQDVISAYDKYKEGLLGNTVFVKGERKNRNFFDNLFTQGMAVISSIALNFKVWDVNAQPKIFHKSLMDSLTNAPLDFSLDLYVLFIAKRNHLPIECFPVDFSKRLHGVAKGGGSIKGKIKLVKRTISYVFKLRKEIKSGQR